MELVDCQLANATILPSLPFANGGDMPACPFTRVDLVAGRNVFPFNGLRAKIKGGD